MKRIRQQGFWWLAPQRLARVVSLKLCLILAGCGIGGAAAFIAGILLFCTPFGAPLIVAGLAEIYREFKDDDHDHSHCPLIPCPSPVTPRPPGTLMVCFLNGDCPDESRCPAWRFVADQAGMSDRPIAIFEATSSVLSDQHIIVDEWRMSYPSGQDWLVNGRTISGSQLICSFITIDDNGDGSGDRWMTTPGLVDFEVWYGNGDHGKTSAALALGGLGGPVFIDHGTTTIKHGWMPSGVKFYGVTHTAASMVKTMMLTDNGDFIDLPSVEEACMLTGDLDGHWEQVSATSFRFVADW